MVTLNPVEDRLKRAFRSPLFTQQWSDPNELKFKATLKCDVSVSKQNADRLRKEIPQLADLEALPRGFSFADTFSANQLAYILDFFPISLVGVIRLLKKGKLLQSPGRYTKIVVPEQKVVEQPPQEAAVSHSWVTYVIDSTDSSTAYQSSVPSNTSTVNAYQEQTLGAFWNPPVHAAGTHLPLSNFTGTYSLEQLPTLLASLGLTQEDSTASTE